VLLVAITSFPTVGKLVVFAGLHAEAPLGIWGYALMTWVTDLVVAVLLLTCLSRLERTAVVGGWLRRVRAGAARALRDYPGLRRMAFLGVAAFVFLPIAGTGPISGSFAARLLGLSRATGLAAIALGAASSAALFALLAIYLGQRAETLVSNPLVATAVTVAILLLAWLLWLRVRARLRTP
jgi:uncharacterized membrane protein